MDNLNINRRLGTFLALMIAFVISTSFIPVSVPIAHAKGLDGVIGTSPQVERPGGDPSGAPDDSISGQANAQDSVGNINTNKTGTLFIHKFAGPETGADNDGTDLGFTGTPKYPENKPLAGIEFTIYKVNGVDLTKAEDWAKLAPLHNPKAPVTITEAGEIHGVDGVSKGDQVGKGETDDFGVVDFEKLPVGAYIVVETDNSNAKYFDPNIGDEDYQGEPVKVTKVVKPFIVTVPFPTTKQNVEADNGWLYKIHVYPKNEIRDELSKKLVSNNKEAADIETADNPQDNATRLTKGGELEWKITALIPSKAKPFKKFVVYDNLENGTVGGTAPVVSPFDDDSDNGPDTFTAAGPTPDYTVNGTDTAKVEIEFTEAGRAKLYKHRGEKLSVTLYAKVKQDLNDDPQLGKVVKNSSYGLTYRVGEDPDDTTVTPPPDQAVPIAYFGDFYLKKVSSVPANNPMALKGAVFAVYATKADAKAKTNPLYTADASNENGIVVFKDLFRGDAPDSQRHYWVREIEAPAGYKLNDTPVFIKVAADTGKAAQSTSGDNVFKNTPYVPGDLPDLPLTGASGKLLMTLGGAAIVLFAAGTVLVTRRRQA